MQITQIFIQSFTFHNNKVLNEIGNTIFHSQCTFDLFQIAKTYTITYNDRNNVKVMNNNIPNKQITHGTSLSF